MATPIRSGIPTAYRGTHFRSRLEARWAAFFDLVRWSWTYEPFDAAGWIPDFLIQGERPFLIEIGPCASLDELEAKASKAMLNPERPTLVLGMSPTILGVDGGYHRAGLLIHGTRTTSIAWWDRGKLLQLGVSTHAGDTLPEPGAAFGVSRADWPWFEALWRRAGNEVQWRGPQRVGNILQGLEGRP